MKVMEFLQRKWRGVSNNREMIKRQLVSSDPTENYRPPRRQPTELLVDELPLFNLFMARLMVRDPIVQIGLDARNAALMSGEVEVESDDTVLAEYVKDLIDTLWQLHGFKLRRTKRWGFGGYQIDYEPDKLTGLLKVSGVKEFSPYDVRALTVGGQAVGFRVRSSGGRGTTSASTYDFKSKPLYAPKGLWLTFEGIYGNYYGNSILKRSYAPWYEKWMPHGAKKTTQLRMIKDAYLGDVIYFPAHMSAELPNGQEIPYSEIARELTENRMSGATMRIPMLHDENGNKLLEYTKPSDTGNPTGIYQWGDNLDRDIWRGLGVFEELIVAAASGSGFSGRSVPLSLFLAGCSQEYSEYVSSIVEFIVKPLVWTQFGPNKMFRVKPKSLLDTFAEQMGGGAGGGGGVGGPEAIGGMEPQEMSGGQTPTVGSPGNVQFAQGPEGKTLREIVARKKEEMGKARHPGPNADFEQKHPRAGGKFASKAEEVVADDESEKDEKEEEHSIEIFDGVPIEEKMLVHGWYQPGDVGVGFQGRIKSIQPDPISGRFSVGIIELNRPIDLHGQIRKWISVRADARQVVRDQRFGQRTERQVEVNPALPPRLQRMAASAKQGMRRGIKQYSELQSEEAAWAFGEKLKQEFGEAEKQYGWEDFDTYAQHLESLGKVEFDQSKCRWVECHS